MDSHTIICRCEELTLREIRNLIKQGFQNTDEMKRISRADMGQCQGRTCRMLLAREIANAINQSLDEILMPTFRLPTKGVKLGVLAGGGWCE